MRMTSCSAAVRARSRFSVMLALVSTSTIAVIGWKPFTNTVSSCRRPSSSTMKSLAFEVAHHLAVPIEHGRVDRNGFGRPAEDRRLLRRILLARQRVSRRRPEQRSWPRGPGRMFRASRSDPAATAQESDRFTRRRPATYCPSRRLGAAAARSPSSRSRDSSCARGRSSPAP